MALTRAQKEAQLADLKKKMQLAKSVMFAHYIGLNVSEISRLRAKLKEQKAEMKVGKKTLIQLAAKELKLPDISEQFFPGAVACIFSNEDPTIGASTAYAYGKDHPQVKIIGGIFEGKLLDRATAVEFAKLPGRQVLLAIFMGMIQSPLRSFASLCSSPLSGFARSLSALAKKKEAVPS